MPAAFPLPLNDDRRHQERRILRVQAELHRPGHAPLAVRTIDISEGGISVLCPLNLPARTECTIRTSLPIPPTGRKPVELSAVVRYSILSSCGGGFQLGMIVPFADEATQAAIQLYMKN